MMPNYFSPAIAQHQQINTSKSVITCSLTTENQTRANLFSCLFWGKSRLSRIFRPQILPDFLYMSALSPFHGEQLQCSVLRVKTWMQQSEGNLASLFPKCDSWKAPQTLVRQLKETFHYHNDTGVWTVLSFHFSLCYNKMPSLSWTPKVFSEVSLLASGPPSRWIQLSAITHFYSKC